MPGNHFPFLITLSIMGFYYLMNRLPIEASNSERYYWAGLWKCRELFFFLP